MSERVSAVKPSGSSGAPLLELTLESLGHGPFAIGRRDGQAVLVRGGAPGDEVTARITRRHARYLEAALVAVKAPGPGRRIAPCPAHPLCGGCPWQHLHYPDQLAAKTANVRRELARLEGGAAAFGEAFAAPAEWAYRRRIRLSIDAHGRVGFLRAESHAVVEIESCPIAEPAAAAAIAPARALVRELATPVTACDVNARGELPGAILTFSAAGPFGRGDRGRIERFLARKPEVAGVVVAGHGFTFNHGAVTIRHATAAGSPVDLPPAIFTQAHAAANELLIARVLAAAAPAETMRALELFAGAGNFTLELAPRVAALHAVELNMRAAAALRRAVRRHPHVTVERATAAAALARATAAGERYDLVVLDPPRTGLRAETAPLVALGALRLVLVSCDLATFTRDARALIAGGYRLARVDLVDLFPQTYHAELVAAFVLTAG
jgi:23S rRNA (uracil1939-C5)-methyltransferase